MGIKKKLTHNQSIALEILRQHPNEIVMNNGYLTGGHGIKINRSTINSLRDKGVLTREYRLADEYRLNMDEISKNVTEFTDTLKDGLKAHIPQKFLNQIGNTKPIVEFNGYTCVVRKSQYRDNDRIALILKDVNGDEQDTITATVNVPEISLKDDEVLIKNYSENEGILEVLTKAGLIKPICEIPANFVRYNLCKLLF